MKTRTLSGLRCLVAQACEEAAKSGFSWRGEALPFVPYVDMGKALSARRTGADYTMAQAHENGRAAHPGRAKAARIRVEQIDEPVMVIGGDKDTTWASGPMARAIVAARDAAGLETEAYTYENASHGVGGSPLNPTSLVNAKARLENFPAMMNFLKRNSKRKNCRK